MEQYVRISPILLSSRCGDAQHGAVGVEYAGEIVLLNEPEAEGLLVEASGSG